MKRIRRIWMGLVILMVLGSCRDMQINKSNSQFLPMQETDQIKFYKSWKRWDRPNSMRLYSYVLKGTVTIKGVPCKSQCNIDSLGDLYSFVLGEDFELNGTLFQEGSRYETRLGREDQRIGYMIYPAKPCHVQGYYVRNKSGISDYHLEFYLDGSLKSFKTFEDLEIDGIPCKGGKKSGISLYPDGRLLICHLSKDFEIKGKLFPEGTHLIFDEEGNASEYSTKQYFQIMKELSAY